MVGIEDQNHLDSITIGCKIGGLSGWLKGCGGIKVWMGFVLKEKLNGLKTGIKEWYRIEYREVEEKNRKLVEDIVDLDKKGEEARLGEVEV